MKTIDKFEEQVNGIIKQTEIRLIYEGKNNCNHEFIESPEGSSLAVSPPIYVNPRICKHCGRLEEVRRRTVDRRKQEFRKLYEFFHGNK